MTKQADDLLRNLIGDAIVEWMSQRDRPSRRDDGVIDPAGIEAEFIVHRLAEAGYAIAPAATAPSGLWLALPAEFTDEQWDRLAFGDYCGMFSGLTREQNAETWNASGSGDELGWINKSMFRKHAAGVIAELRELAAEPAVPE